MIYDHFFHTFIYLLNCITPKKNIEKDFIIFVYGNNVTIAPQSLFGHVG